MLQKCGGGFKGCRIHGNDVLTKVGSEFGDLTITL